METSLLLGPIERANAALVALFRMDTVLCDALLGGMWFHVRVQKFVTRS
jgi:hypothetical protein